MSITPLPDLPPEPEGIHLSALDSYAGRPGTLPGVNFWPRVLARIIDLAIHYVISICSGFLVGFFLAIVALLLHTSFRALMAHRAPGRIALFAFSMLGLVAVEAICEGFHGSTPGKLMLSMVVVQEDGSPCRPGPAWIRSFAYYVDALFFGLIGYFSMEKSLQRQRHGDEWAHTIVCRRSDVAPQNLRGISQFALALFFAVLVDAALIILGAVISLTT